MRDRADIRDSMVQGHALYERGDFPGSIKEYRRVQSLARDGSPSDAASFNIGLIYADPRNPQRDTRQAIGAFRTVIARHPESPWVDQSRIWVATLEDLVRTNQEVEKSKLEVEKTKRFLGQSQSEVEKTKQVLEKSRQVDIEIEKKRRLRRK